MYKTFFWITILHENGNEKTKKLKNHCLAIPESNFTCILLIHMK